jgi:hypothetical protein
MDFDWATWAILIGCSLVVLLPILAVVVILAIIFFVRRRDTRE